MPFTGYLVLLLLQTQLTLPLNLNFNLRMQAPKLFSLSVFPVASMQKKLTNKKCYPLLETSMQAAKGAGIPNNRVYLLEMPKEFAGPANVPFKSVSDLIAEGARLPKLEALRWTQGQGARQTAYLCYSSGTSGLPVSMPFPNCEKILRFFC